MSAILPDFTPRDPTQSHSLWYASSQAAGVPAGARDALAADGASATGVSHGSHVPRARGQAMDRTTLARLAADEQAMLRRCVLVQDFGSSWLKPPGVPKSLHQMREERHEHEEHQEALRREQRAQELAEAEAAAAAPDDGMMDDVQLDGTQDLDDDIPDADDQFALGGDDDDDDNDEYDDNDDAADSDEDDHGGNDNDHDADADDDAVLREERQASLMTARMRMTDAFREALVRGGGAGDDLYGAEEVAEPEDQDHMLDEADFAPRRSGHGHTFLHALDMDANLDDIPEAASGGYEHTDSEADDDDDADDAGDNSSPHGRSAGDDDAHYDNLGFIPRTTLAPPLSPTVRRRHSMASPRSSMDLSHVLSHDETSFMDSSSSPTHGRRARHG